MNELNYLMSPQPVELVPNCNMLMLIGNTSTVCFFLCNVEEGMKGLY